MSAAKVSGLAVFVPESPPALLPIPASTALPTLSAHPVRSSALTSEHEKKDLEGIHRTRNLIVIGTSVSGCVREVEGINTQEPACGKVEAVVCGDLSPDLMPQPRRTCFAYVPVILKDRPDGDGAKDYGLVYGRVSAGGVCPSTNAGLPCDVMVTVEEVRPGELAVMTLVPE